MGGSYQFPLLNPGGGCFFSFFFGQVVYIVMSFLSFLPVRLLCYLAVSLLLTFAICFLFLVSSCFLFFLPILIASPRSTFCFTKRNFGQLLLPASSPAFTASSPHLCITVRTGQDPAKEQERSKADI